LCIVTNFKSYGFLSVYLHNILKNHTAHACEGDTLAIECPSRTSVAVLSAFYGRRVPNQHLCPSANTNTTGEEDKECTSPVAIEVNESTVRQMWHRCFGVRLSRPTLQSHTFCLQKVASECQDRQFCHIPVFSPVFGPDPCPLTSKYLLVSYKCRPGMSLWSISSCGQLTVVWMPVYPSDHLFCWIESIKQLELCVLHVLENKYKIWISTVSGSSVWIMWNSSLTKQSQLNSSRSHSLHQHGVFSVVMMMCCICWHTSSVADVIVSSLLGLFDLQVVDNFDKTNETKH